MKTYNYLRQAILFPALILFAFMVTLAACDVINVDSEKGKGQINFHLADASDEAKLAFATTSDSEKKPSLDGLEEVNIDIRELRVLFFASASDSASVDTTDNEFDEGDGQWITIDTTDVQLNLFELTHSDTLLAEVELEDGYYSELRLILGDDNNVVVDGETHPLKVPSGQQSGYKVKLGEPLHSGEIMDITIEFDAGKSVHTTGNGKYMLKPVLHTFKGQMEL